MKLGVVLGSGAPADAALAARLLRAAAVAGHDARLFVMGAGVQAIAELSRLADEGVDVIACERSLEEVGVARPCGVLGGSQLDHAALVRDCQRVVALT